MACGPLEEVVVDDAYASSGPGMIHGKVRHHVTVIRARRSLIALIVIVVLVVLRWSQITDLAGSSRGVLLQAVVTGLLLGGVYGLVAMGLSLIFGVLGIINFAHGTIVTVGLYVSYLLVTDLGLDPYLALPATVVILFVFGSFIQKFMIRRTLGQPLENQLLLTVGLSILLQNLLLIFFSPTPRSIRVDYANTQVDILGATASLSRVIAFVGALIIGLLLWLLLKKTNYGTSIRAVAQNPKGAALVGINVRQVYIVAFALGIACAGAAASLILPFLTIDPLVGEPFTILAFVTVILGGLGNVVGALVGGLVIGLVYEIGGLLLPGQDKLLLVFIVFVLVLLARPQGLFVREHR